MHYYYHSAPLKFRQIKFIHVENVQSEWSEFKYLAKQQSTQLVHTFPGTTRFCTHAPNIFINVTDARSNPLSDGTDQIIKYREHLWIFPGTQIIRSETHQVLSRGMRAGLRPSVCVRRQPKLLAHSGWLCTQLRSVRARSALLILERSKANFRLSEISFVAL